MTCDSSPCESKEKLGNDIQVFDSPDSETFPSKPWEGQDPKSECAQQMQTVSGTRSLSTEERHDLEQVQTSASIPEPPPDGGWRAWSQVIGVHLVSIYFPLASLPEHHSNLDQVVFNTWGSIQTFGAWQSYYTAHLN